MKTVEEKKRRRRFRIGLAAVAVLAWTRLSPGLSPSHAGLKKRVAVVDMALTAAPSGSGNYTSSGVSMAPPSDLAVGLTEMLTTELVKTGRFIVLERKALGDILGEQDLATGGRVSTETGAKTGVVIGAQALVRCAITEYSYKQNSSSGGFKGFRGISLGGNSIRAIVGIDTRIYDSTTSEVLASMLAHGTATSGGLDVKYSDSKVDVGSSTFQSTPLGKASREAIDEAVRFLVAKLGDLPWEARVIRADGKTLYLNAGEESGLSPGQTFTVFRAGEALVDPASGIRLGSPDRAVGTVRITAVRPKYSVAQVLSGDAPQRNDLVREGSAENP
ncbi:MAG: hypothetical protein M3167_14645 [Acidobacteriota bacterium]|nr:hypothetical protein [Acidobacteriota bacterium]